MVVRLASEARYSPSEFWSGSTAQTLTLGEILLSTWSAERNSLSAAQYSITWSSAWPPPVMTLKRRVPIDDLLAMRDAAVGRRQDRNPLQIILAAAEQLVGQVLVHAVTAEEQPLRVAPLLGAAVLVIDRLQIFDLRHVAAGS